MRKELSGTGCEKPDEVGEDNIPPGQMVPAILDRNGTFPDKITDEARSYKEREGVKELVDLKMKIDKMKMVMTSRAKTTCHSVRDIGMRGPNMSLREQRA